MRSCIGTILLIILLVFIGVTALYLWESNNRIEFSVRDDEEPESSETSQQIKNILPKKDVPPPTVENNVMTMDVPAPPTQEDPPSLPESNTDEPTTPTSPEDEEIRVAEPVE